MHVYVRLSGWGIQVLPEGDFDATWNEDARDVDLTLFDGKFARIHVDGEGGYQSKVDPRTTKSLYDVAAIRVGEADPYWRLETSLYRFAWPIGYRISCSAVDAPGICADLLGPNGECIFIQNPASMPGLGQMVGPGQAILDQDDAARSILLGYEVNGVEWRLRHTIVTVGSRDFVLTGQASSSVFPGVERAMLEIVSSLEVTPES
ncbi:MAG TPA: hypothetical protein VGE67_17980 [Haloferula sp.]